MNNEQGVLIRKILILSLLTVVSLGLFGCANMAGVVAVDKRVLFHERENSQGTFTDGALTVHYKYNRTGEKLHLAGDVSYRERVDLLDVLILFLDSTGSVVQEKIIYSSGYRTYIDWKAEQTFHENLVVPPGAVGISFSYSALPYIHKN